MSGNYITIFPVDDIWFFGVNETKIFDLVRIVAPWADILEKRKLPGVKVNLGK